jgi:hypothetical protein
MKLSRYFRRISYFLAVGLLATVTMDIAALATVGTGIVQLGPYRIFPELLGRWVGSIPAGSFVHSTILTTRPVPHEKVLGVVSHYLIGLTLSSLLLFPHVSIWHRRVTLRTAVLFGMASCVFPYFLMFPSMGFGIMALKLPHPATLILFSAWNHVAFGLGIFLWSNFKSFSNWRRTELQQENLGPAAS